MEVRNAIAEQWLDRVLRTHPGEPARFPDGEPDPFRNPVGYTIRQALGTLLDEMLLGMDAGKVAAALDSIVQIRAVQDLPPGRALEFLFQLKTILRGYDVGPSLDLLYSRIDAMALQAFDLYVSYREKTYQVKANEARRQVYVLERSVGLRLPALSRQRGAK